ncbi:hypothetical protein [Nocardiopsis sp. MG754419]|uniref:hypothetical protein n=1 Tax=Nocardiopsis sp. MG754419 TaxID=2259865 RepID=UPI001BA5EFD1|nr:hypothetical protein [Nocardiopsis sp. MG754419]MBR8743310.1 hypothetical protein [Nocardiopsis sp. MG754419]
MTPPGPPFAVQPPPSQEGLSLGAKIALVAAGLGTLFLVLATVATFLWSGPDDSAAPSTPAEEDTEQANIEEVPSAENVEEAPSAASVEEGPGTPPDFPEPEHLSSSGTGDTAVDLGEPFSDPRIIALSHEGEGEFAVWSQGPEDESMHLVHGGEGPYEGRILFRPFLHDETAVLHVTADGAWEFTVEPLTAATPWYASDTEFSGAGDEVLQLLWDPEEMAELEAAHHGSSIFTVRGLAMDDTIDPMFYEIGPSEGSEHLREGTVLLEVSAEDDAEWMLTR